MLISSSTVWFPRLQALEHGMLPVYFILTVVLAGLSLIPTHASSLIGGMLFGGGIILTTCIERLVAKSSNAPVLQFWFDKVPLLDGLIVN